MDNYEEFCKEFVSKSKSLLIAPAGCGKTYTIAECLKYTEGKQLILTHTHAGVASLKEKIKEKGISTSKYRVETISSFAQKYVNAFYCGDDIPEQDDKQAYFPFIIEKATELMKIKPIRDVVKLTYSGLFVDEYQDCTKLQHKFIMALSEILPTHVLGDPLQGIFGFRQDLVNFEKDLHNFKKFELREPWRWKKTNPELGESLMKIRKKLENEEDIDLTSFEDVVEIIYINNENDIYNGYYRRKIWDLINDEYKKVLVIHPNSASKNARLKFVKGFRNRIRIVEAIDDEDFYKYAKMFDEVDSSNLYKVIYEFIKQVFKKEEIDKWFNENRMKEKRNREDQLAILPVKKDMESLEQQGKNFILIAKILRGIKDLPGMVCYREELFNDVCKALEEAGYNKTSVYETIKRIKNMKRRMGRKIDGKCIGTTLLVKGLEFDVVVILSAHKFEKPEDLYVALTRASEKLVVFTKSTTLHPYSN